MTRPVQRELRVETAHRGWRHNGPLVQPGFARVALALFVHRYAPTHDAIAHHASPTRTPRVPEAGACTARHVKEGSLLPHSGTLARVEIAPIVTNSAGANGRRDLMEIVDPGGASRALQHVRASNAESEVCASYNWQAFA